MDTEIVEEIAGRKEKVMLQRKMCENIESIQQQMVIQNCAPHIRVFEGDSYENFVRWKTDMDLTLSQISDVGGHAARPLAMKTLRGQAAMYAAHLLIQQPEITWTELKQKMETRYFDTVNRTLIKRQMKDFKQKEHEDVRDCYLRLVKLATRMYGQELYSSTVQTLIVDTFIEGISDEQLACELLRKSPSTLEEALMIATNEQQLQRSLQLRMKREDAPRTDSECEPTNHQLTQKAQPAPTLMAVRVKTRRINQMTIGNQGRNRPYCHRCRMFGHRPIRCRKYPVSCGTCGQRGHQPDDDCERLRHLPTCPGCGRREQPPESRKCKRTPLRTSLLSCGSNADEHTTPSTSLNFAGVIQQTLREPKNV